MEGSMTRKTRLLISAAVILFVAARLSAQGGLGSISGTILDQTGVSLPGADIRIVEKSTGLTRIAISNEVGLFNVPSLPAGLFSATVSLQNFKTKAFDNLTVNSFQQLSLGQVTLELAVGP